MKPIDRLRNRHGVVLDTMVFIYLFEDAGPLAATCQDLLDRMAAGLFGGVVTPITAAELLVKPLKQRRADVADRYRNALAAFPNLSHMALDEDAGCMAAALRAKYSLPLPDLLQAAAALRAPKPTLVTNDRDLARVEEIEVVLLSQLAG